MYPFLNFFMAFHLNQKHLSKVGMSPSDHVVDDSFEIGCCLLISIRHLIYSYYDLHFIFQTYYSG